MFKYEKSQIYNMQGMSILSTICEFHHEINRMMPFCQLFMYDMTLISLPDILLH